MMMHVAYCQLPIMLLPIALICLLSSFGALAWIRLERKDELRVCYRGKASRSSFNRKMVVVRQ